MKKEWIVSDEDLGCDGAYFSYTEIVRCKDCKYRRNSRQGWYCGYEYDRSDPYEMTRRADDENYYCADAERKEHE